MTESATVTRRDERKAATSSRLTEVARRLTLERGLSGFTIEELCDEVGISRRTFFNYFPSKDEAVLGMHESDQSAQIESDFLALGSRGWPVVLDDLVAVAIAHTAFEAHDAVAHAEFFAMLDREPKLLSRVIGLTRDREQALATTIARREGVPTDDIRAHAVVGLFSTILRLTVERSLRPGAPTDFADALHSTLAASREVAVSLPPRKDPS